MALRPGRMGGGAPPCRGACSAAPPTPYQMVDGAPFVDVVAKLKGAVMRASGSGRPLRLCMASRPGSAAVATAMTPLERDTAAEAAMLLARYAARHPMRGAW